MDRKNIIIGCICGLMSVTIAASFLILSGNKEMIVGNDIENDDITEFFYTYDSSAYPPDYQRYHFYKKEGSCYFYHEKREGINWPLTESDITLSGSMELTDEEWKQFLDYLEEGKVKNREKNIESGNRGPRLYLYWNGDCSKYQEFSFSSLHIQNLFEEFCISLTENIS